MRIAGNLTSEARIEMLGRTAIFGAVREDVVAVVAARGRTIEVSRGDFFFRQGDGGTEAFLLETGEAEVLKEWNESLHPLRRLVPGDCFGEVALLDFGPRSASIRARSDCQALEICAANLREVARGDAEQFALVYMNLGRELARRLRAADERLFRARFGRDTRPDEG